MSKVEAAFALGFGVDANGMAAEEFGGVDPFVVVLDGLFLFGGIGIAESAFTVNHDKEVLNAEILRTFLEVADAVREKADTEPQVVNTICSATRDRQDAARALAGQVDAFYVIGGRHSSNSVKLLAVCQEQCEKSYLIETPAEINPADLENVKKVGVTAGASTPNWLIDQVVERLHQIGGR